MSSSHLNNLVKVGLLDPVPFAPEMLARMLSAAKTRLADAQQVVNSAETRFDCAYNTIRSIADAGLFARGYRTSTSKPGHHQTSLQCLVHTMDIDPMTVRVLDALRKQRNLSDYDGDLVTEVQLRECIEQAHSLMTLADQMLATLATTPHSQ